MMKKAAVVVGVALVLLSAAVFPVHADEGNPPPSGRGGAIVDALRSIAVLVIDILIGVAVIIMSVGIATGFVGGQFLVTVGEARGLSIAWIRVISVVLLGIGGMLTITIVNTIVNAIADLIPPTQIPSI